MSRIERKIDQNELDSHNLRINNSPPDQIFTDQSNIGYFRQGILYFGARIREGVKIAGSLIFTTHTTGLKDRPANYEEEKKKLANYLGREGLTDEDFERILTEWGKERKIKKLDPSQVDDIIRRDQEEIRMGNLLSELKDDFGIKEFRLTQEILERMINSGMTNQEIADATGYAVDTVSSYKKRFGIK